MLGFVTGRVGVKPWCLYRSNFLSPAGLVRPPFRLFLPRGPNLRPTQSSEKPTMCCVGGLVRHPSAMPCAPAPTHPVPHPQPRGKSGVCLRVRVCQGQSCL